MDEAILVELAHMVCAHPWWRARARLTSLCSIGSASEARRGCSTPAVDGGRRSGADRRGYRAAGMDISRRSLERLDRPGRELYVADLTRDLIGNGNGFEAVLALDVIEHIDDDRAAVTRLGRLVRPGGVVILSVPALPEFFSEFDEIQGHRRRYLPETLRAAFSGSDLAVERVFWWGQWLVPMSAG